MALHGSVIGSASHGVKEFCDLTAARGTIRLWRLLQFFKNLDRSNDRTVLAAYRHGTCSNRDFMASLVIKNARPLGIMRRLHRMGQRTLLIAKFTTRLIAMEKRVGNAAAPEYLVAEMPRDPFSAVAPEYNSFLRIEDAHSRREALENVAAKV